MADIRENCDSIESKQREYNNFLSGEFYNQVSHLEFREK